MCVLSFHTKGLEPRNNRFHAESLEAISAAERWRRADACTWLGVR